jgi:hypothetical protein
VEREVSHFHRPSPHRHPISQLIRVLMLDDDVYLLFSSVIYSVDVLSPLNEGVIKKMLIWCCYITLDFAIAASRNGFMLAVKAFPKKTIFSENDKKNLIFYYFYLLSWSSREARSFLCHIC